MSKEKMVKLLRKEVKLGEDVVEILERAARADHRSLIPFLEKLLIDKSLQLKQEMDETILTGKRKSASIPKAS